MSCTPPPSRTPVLAILLAGCLVLAFPRIASSGDLAGTVVAESGGALADVTVVAFGVVDSTAYEAVTDQEGQWQIADVPDGPYLITFRKEGFEPLEIDMEVSPDGTEAIEVVLIPQRDPLANRFAGVVVDATDGRPLEGAAVKLFHAADDVRNYAATGEEGRFAFTNIEPLIYELEAQYGGYETFAGDAVYEVTATSVIDDIRIELVRTFTSFAQLSGRITDTAGASLDEAFIELTRLPRDATDTVDVFTLYQERRAAGATFAFDDLVPGLYIARVVASGFIAERFELELDDGAAETLDVVLRREVSTGDVAIRGVVTDGASGDVLPGAVLTLGGRIMEVAYQTRADADGRFALQGLIAQPYDVIASAFGYEAVRDTLDLSTGRDRSDLSYALTRQFGEPASIEGLVRDADTQAPIPGARIELVSREEVFADSAWVSGYYTTETDAEGRFRIEGAVPGAYILRVAADGYATITREQALADGEAAEVTVDLPPSAIGTLSGTVTYEDGQPAGWVEVVALPDPRMDEPAGEPISIYLDPDGGGYYAFDLAAGTYVVLAQVATADSAETLVTYYDGAASLDEATPVDVGSGDVVEGIDLILPGAPPESDLRIEGAVVDAATGTLLTEAEVRAVALGSGRVVGTASTDAEGRYALDVSRAHRAVHVVAEAEGFAARYHPDALTAYLAEPVRLDRAGETLTIDFSLPPVNAEGDAEASFVAGQVLDADGAPIAGAQVMAYDPAGTLIAADRSRDDGRYQLAPLALSGRYYVLAMAEGYVPTYLGGVARWEGSDPIRLASADGLEASFRLDRLVSAAGVGSVAGYAFAMAVEQPASGAVVTVHNPDGAVVAYAVADREGAFVVHGLGPGTYTLRIAHVGMETVEQTFDIGDEAGSRALGDFGMAPSTSTPTDGEPEVPQRLALDSAYPNPFNPSTTITFALDQTGPVRLGVYDMLGREVAVLVDEVRAAGSHTAVFDAPVTLASGPYLLRLDAEGRTRTRSVLLLK